MMAGTFTLYRNDVVKIVVGQRGLTGTGEDSTLYSGGGGGGTFVVKQGSPSDTVLVIAGGGGGGSGDCVNWNLVMFQPCLSASTSTSGGFTYSSGQGRGTNGDGGAAGDPAYYNSYSSGGTFLFIAYLIIKFPAFNLLFKNRRWISY